MSEEGNVIGWCPAHGAPETFTFLGVQEGYEDLPDVDLWNCEQGDTVSTDSIVGATVRAAEGGGDG